MRGVVVEGLTKARRVLTVVDIYPRSCPAGEDVVQTLGRVCGQIGCPKTRQGDKGSELVSCDLDLWAHANGFTRDISRPVKPTDNGFTEAFNS